MESESPVFKDDNNQFWKYSEDIVYLLAETSNKVRTKNEYKFICLHKNPLSVLWFLENLKTFWFACEFPSSLQQMKSNISHDECWVFILILEMQQTIRQCNVLQNKFAQKWFIAGTICMLCYESNVSRLQTIDCIAVGICALQSDITRERPLWFWHLNNFCKHLFPSSFNYLCLRLTRQSMKWNNPTLSWLSPRTSSNGKFPDSCGNR